MSRDRQGKIYLTGQSEAGHGRSLIAIDPANRENRVVLTTVHHGHGYRLAGNAWSIGKTTQYG